MNPVTDIVFSITWVLLLAVMLCVPEGIQAKPFDYNSERGREAISGSAGLYEGESLVMKGTSRIQGMRHFGNQWSGDSHLLWLGVIGDAMETEFPIPAKGNYRLVLQMTTAPDYGVFSVVLNNSEIREKVDLYSAQVALSAEVHLGEFQMNEGMQKLAFVLKGATAQAHAKGGKQYMLGLDFVPNHRVEKSCVRRNE